MLFGSIIYETHIFSNWKDILYRAYPGLYAPQNHSQTDEKSHTHHKNKSKGMSELWGGTCGEEP